jgi:hypothetical protein
VTGTRLTRRFTSRSIHGCGRSIWSRGKEHGSEPTCPFTQPLPPTCSGLPHPVTTADHDGSTNQPTMLTSCRAAYIRSPRDMPAVFAIHASRPPGGPHGIG